ncbi:MAG TPA: YcaO-like family protein [Gaiellaceae bacterium]|nr:YcaO-like family protein [Gaiellaceae bacterium]
MLELRPVQPTPLDVTLPRLEGVVSPYTGIVRSTVEHLGAHGEARFVGTGCLLAATDEVLGARSVDTAGGAHVSRPASRAAALGEAVERYAGTASSNAERPRVAAATLGAAAVDPALFTFFRPEQLASPGFPFVPFTTRTRIRWAPGFRVPTCEPVLLPAQLVHLGPPPPDEPLIAYATSSGLACGGTLEEAILSGLLELVERDAFMVVWANRLSLPLLDSTGDPVLERIERLYLAPAGLRFAAVDASCFFGIPVAFGVVHGPDGDAGRLGLGAAAAITIQEAVRKALAEAFWVQQGSRDLVRGAEAVPHADEIRDFDDHLLFHSDPATHELTAFLDASDERRSTREVPSLEGGDLRALIEAAEAKLSARGVSLYAADVTSQDIREVGLSVARVLSPELCPLDVIHLARFLGPRRLFHAAHELGLRETPLTMSTVNHDPHPFP